MLRVYMALSPEDCDWCHALADGRLHFAVLCQPHCCADCLATLPAFRQFRESGDPGDLPDGPARQHSEAAA